MMAEQFITIKGKKFKIGVEVFIFQEDNQFIAYSPSLELSSYGSSYVDAGNAFEEAASIFFKYAQKKGTLIADLLELGWTITKKPKTVFSAPDLEETIHNNPVLQSLIASGQYKKSQATIAVPAYI